MAILDAQEDFPNSIEENQELMGEEVKGDQFNMNFLPPIVPQTRQGTF